MSCFNRSFSSTNGTSSLDCLVENVTESISRMVEMDSASLVMWLIGEGLFSDPSCEEYDEEDERYHQEYADDEPAINN